MNSDFRVSVGFQHNAKIRALRKRLGPAGPLCLIHLWAYVAQYYPEGRLPVDLVSRAELEAVVGWSGARGRLVDTMLELRLIEERDGYFYIHDWDVHNGYASAARIRSARARAAAMRRHHAHDAQADASAYAQADASAYAPSPSPSPSPSLLNVSASDKPTRKPAQKKHPLEVTDEWIDSIQGSPAYQGIDVRAQIERARVWLSAHPGRRMTRRFVINWLNRCEPVSAGKADPPSQTAASPMDECIRELEAMGIRKA